MRSRTTAVLILTVFITLWRLVTWWSIAGLGNEYSGTRILGVMGISILVIGFTTFNRIKNRLSFVFFLYCSAMAFHWGGYPIFSEDGNSVPILTLYSFLSIFLGSTILHFSILYPKMKYISTWKLMAIYSPGILGILSVVASLLDQKVLELFIGFEPLIVTIFALIGAVLLFRIYFRTPPVERRMIGANIICIGIILANFPYLFSEFIPVMNFGDGIGFIFYRLLFILQPIAFAIAVLKTDKFSKQLDSTLVSE